MNVPLFKIPASEKELHKIILRLKNKVNDHPAAKNREEKTAAVVPPPPAFPRSKSSKAKRSVNSDGFAPSPKQLVRKSLSPRSSPPPSPSPLPRFQLKARFWKGREKRRWIFRSKIRCKLRPRSMCLW
ncbi:hypothetical protein TNCV_323681 [Trichonephila clavipes]|nr:hypothetical protein TNCV_323681 [Trichonephila clavipes]